MGRRVTALGAVVAFALGVAALAVTAGRGDDEALVKLPVAALGGRGAEDAAATASGTSLAFPAFGPVEYRVDAPLPDLPGTAPAYRLGAAATAAAVARLADAVNLAGEPRRDGEGWLVTDGTRELRVQSVPGLPWYLGETCPDAPVSSDGARVEVTCAVGVAVAEPVAGAGSSGVASPGVAVVPPAPPADVPAPAPAPVARPDVPVATTAPCTAGTLECAPQQIKPAETAPLPAPVPMPVPPDAPERPADLPSRGDAERIAREAFERMGVALDGFAMDDGWLSWEARVDRRVDGLPLLGLGQFLSVGPKGVILRGSGFLAEPDRIGDYPLAGLEKGLDRLREGGGAGPRPLVAADDVAVEPAPPRDLPGAEPAVGDCSDPSVSCLPPPTTVPENAEPVVRVVKGAHLALLHLDATLVPVYVFELDGGEETIPVPAVTDEWLATERSLKP